MFIRFLYCLKEYAYPWIYQKSKENSSGWNHILCSKALGLPSIYRSFTKLLLFCKASEYRMKGLKFRVFFWNFTYLNLYTYEAVISNALVPRRVVGILKHFFFKDEQLYIRYLFSPLSTTFISDRIPNLSRSTEDHSTEWNYLTSGLRFLPDLYSSLKFNEINYLNLSFPSSNLA